jgi:hypothetical protein
MKRLGAIRAEHLLPLACLGAAALLFISELSTTFHLQLGGQNLAVPPGLADTTEAAQRHNYAMLVLGAFAFVLVLAALGGGSKPAALAVAVCGGVALLLFLILDLPDAGKVGSLSAATIPNAKLVPATGFWLELIGSLVLAICGGALATLNREQLQALPRAMGSVRPRAGAGAASSKEALSGERPNPDGSPARRSRARSRS